MTPDQIASVARSITDRLALPPVDVRPVKRADPVFHARLANAYDALPVIRDMDWGAWDAWNSLAWECVTQYHALRAAGMSFIFSESDAYPDSAAMRSDVVENSRLVVFSGGEDHPLLTRTENLYFRAVHDVFGHAWHGYQFGPTGEENAYRCHAQMFSPLACKALLTETRGQNSWVNFGPHSHLPARERPFAKQKAAILPDWASILY